LIAWVGVGTAEWEWEWGLGVQSMLAAKVTHWYRNCPACECSHSSFCACACLTLLSARWWWRADAGWKVSPRECCLLRSESAAGFLALAAAFGLCLGLSVLHHIHHIHIHQISEATDTATPKSLLMSCPCFIFESTYNT
jgi:hypothetical protein